MDIPLKRMRRLCKYVCIYVARCHSGSSETRFSTSEGRVSNLIPLRTFLTFEPRMIPARRHRAFSPFSSIHLTLSFISFVSQFPPAFAFSHSVFFHYFSTYSQLSSILYFFPFVLFPFFSLGPSVFIRTLVYFHFRRRMFEDVTENFMHRQVGMRDTSGIAAACKIFR